jgi:hypothetical protein
MGGDAGGRCGPIMEGVRGSGATRLEPGPKGAHEKFTVLNSVVIFGLEWRAQSERLKSLARPKTFELLTPRS